MVSICKWIGLIAGLIWYTNGMIKGFDLHTAAAAATSILLALFWQMEEEVKDE